MVDSARVRLSVADVSSALGVAASGGKGDMVFEGVSTDSRSTGRGELFVALEGDQFDGHDFIPAALERGASGLVARSSRDVRAPAGVAVFPVRDTLHALGEIARFRRRRLPSRVVGITGSNGKTTTKEITASVVRTKYRTAQTTGNLNNLVGLPMMLLSAAEDAQVLILEMGMNVPGEIGRLAEIAGPDIGVVTNVGPVHLEGVGSVAGVIAEKGMLPASLPADGVAIFEGDTDYSRKLASHTRARRLTFGMNNGSDVRARDVEDLGADGTRATFVLPSGSFSARVPIAGAHNLRNALAAAAVGEALAIPADLIGAGIESAAAPAMRMEIISDPEGFTILNDSYNANPVSMKAGLTFLVEQGREGRRRTIAVLGDMLELGDFRTEGHRQVGAAAAELGVDLIYVIGDCAEIVREGAVSSDSDKRKVFVYAKGEHDSLINDLKSIVRPGDVILVKGSRGMRMERIAQALLTRKERLT